MSVHTFTYLKTVLFAGVLILLNTINIHAATPACNTTLTANTTLDSDMICPSRAINFNAGSANVILDCAGYSISTTDDIVISAAFVSGITIKNCTISTTHDDGRAIRFSQEVTNSTISNNSISTSGKISRGIQLRGDSNSNLITDNTVHTAGSGAAGIQLQASANNNTVTNNTFQTDASYAIDIRSASGNELTGNTLISPSGYVFQGLHSLQNGGMGVDSAGNIYAVENNWGSSAGIGEATAFFLVDPITGAGNSVKPLLSGGVDVGFGFDALEILPDGRIMAFTGSGVGTSPLYEINPNTGEVTAIALNISGLVTGKLNGLEATSNTILLATTNQGELASIDLTTGDVTEIGDQEVGWTDLAIHPTNGKTYTISRHRDEVTETGHLYEINGSVVTEIGDMGSKEVSSIDFAPDGTLYAVGFGNLMVIDITTGLGTTVGSFGGDPLEPLSQNNSIENSVMQTDQGSINFTGSIILPSVAETDVSSERVEISSNEAKVDSTALPFLDEPARITLTGLSGTEKTLLVDENDDGTFEPCLSPQCTLVSFTGGTLVFDVSGFTTYSSINAGAPSAVALVSPADGATGLDTSLTFVWKIATDPNGDNLSYQFFICEDQTFAGCTPTVVASAEKTIDYAGAGGLLPLVLFGTVLGGIGLRRRKWLMMAIVSLAIVGLVSNCGGGGGSTPPPSDEMSHTVSGLKSATTYYWKVAVSDGTDTVESATRSFTTQ